MKTVAKRRRQLEAYVRQQFGSEARLLSFGPIGKESAEGEDKQYGYGSPIRLDFQIGRRVRRVVLETMKAGPFGHEHMADRAQAMLWDYEAYGRLPRHVKAVDVGAFTKDNSLVSVADAREFFVLTDWVDGTSHHLDLERLADGGPLRPLDRRRAVALADYLAQIHAVKRRDRGLYRRRLRELLGHGECIMGLTDSYPDRRGFITGELLRAIEDGCNRWRWQLRGRSHRLSQVHGDFHPWNILFRRGTDFTLLDRSRGEWGEPADDVTALTINYLFFSIRSNGAFKGPLEILFKSFWERYLSGSRDAEICEVCAPFFAFRGLVLAHPLWYPDLSLRVRRTIFRFIENVLASRSFNPMDVGHYLH